jgi:hypothetical protein
LLAAISGKLIYFAIGVVTAIIAMGLTYVDHLLNWKHATSQKKVWEHRYLEPGDHTALLTSAAWRAGASAQAARRE